MKVRQNGQWKNLGGIDVGRFGNYTLLTPEMVSSLGDSWQKYIGKATHLIIDDSLPTNSLNNLFSYNETLKSLVILTNKFIEAESLFKGIGNQFDFFFIDTSNVTDMNNMFNSSKATSLDLSSFDTSNVTDMSSMFRACKATSLDLSSFDTSKVTDMSSMFTYSQATTLDLSSFDTSNVTNMDNMFDNSKATTGYARTQADADRFNASSNKPSGLNFVSIENYTLLTPEMVSGTLGSNSQRYIGTATHLIIDDSFPKSSLNSLFTDNQTLESLVIITNKFTNMSSMCENIGNQFESIFINTSNVTKMDYMFRGSQATTLDLSSFDTSKVTSMNNMFNSSKATSLDLSSFDTSKVTSMNNMFSSSKATSLDLSSFDTSNVTSMEYMFYRSQATTLDLSSFDTSNVTTMRAMFYNSEATTLDLSSFDTSNVTNTTFMFVSSKATVGYARTQADADRFNASSNKPSGLNFVVKEV